MPPRTPAGGGRAHSTNPWKVWGNLVLVFSYEDDEREVVERQAEGVQTLSLSLADAGTFLEIMAVLAALAMIGVGIALLLVTHNHSDGTVTHPLRWPGVGLISGGVVGGVFYWAVARTIRLFARFANANVSALVYAAAILSELAARDGDDE